MKNLVTTSILIFFLSIISSLEAQNLNITQVQPLNGTSGSFITIYGTGFDPASDNTVIFSPAGGGAGTLATVRSSSSRSLAVTVPNVPGGNYTISVQRASDSAINVAIELFAVNTGGGDFGAIGSSEQIVSTSAVGAQSVFAGDVDGDGDLDLMSASSVDAKIAWYENNGGTNPSFTERVVSTSADFAVSVYAADVDGDGDLDLMSASGLDDKIAWYENNGATSPSFTERVVSTSADFAVSVYAVDVDGDGDMDLMSASNVDSTIAWYENDGTADPFFTKRVVSTNANGAQSVYAADVDRDGDLDLLAASRYDDKIAWYENDGATDPSFTERVVSTNANGAISVYAADMDGDGDLDLISASEVDDKIAWYENDGAADPSFTERIVSTNADQAVSVFAADVDGDGDLDLLAASRYDDKIAWYENVSPLAVTQIHTTNGTPGTTLTLYGKGFDVAPTDNTITLSPAGGGAGTTANITSGTSTKLTVNVPSVTGGNYTLSVQRVSDSATDVAIELFAVNTSGGDFGAIGSSKQIVSTSAVGAQSVFAGDVDGDGDLDLMSASSVDAKIAWYENDGTDNPSFTEWIISTTANGTFSVFAGDVDGDGDLDLMSASVSNDKIAWYENNGAADPSFIERVVSTDANAPYSVSAADLDRDGDLDLFSASANDDKIAWYENDGADNPSFIERVVSINADGARSVYAADVDGDGDLDLMSASTFDDKISWYENDGFANPKFFERVVSTTADGARSVSAADVDGDGDLDLLSASYFDFTISWYENDGATLPSFTERVISTNADGVERVFAADVDADGDMDLMSASDLDSTIAWYENDGAVNPSFTEHVVSTNTNGASSIYTGDVDGDGKLDLISSSDRDDTIAWYKNATLVSISGRSLSFDGVDDFVEVPQDNALDLSNQSFTIEFWAKRASTDNIQFALSLGSAQTTNQLLHLGFRNTNAFTFAFFGNDLSTVETYTDTDWHHWAVTFDQTTNARTIYRDGIQVASDISGSAFQGTGDLFIGKVSFGRNFHGTIDEVRIWDVVRTEDQIRQDLFQTLSGDEAGLLAYFPFNEKNGAETTDLTSNGFTGSFSGDVTISNDTHPYGTFITGAEGWRIITAPVNNATYGELLEPLWTQGFTGADSENENSNVSIWNEASQSFTSIANATDIPTAGSGFIAFVYSDDDFDGTENGFPKTIQTNSTQRSGIQSPTLTFTDTGNISENGWNLIGNPYGSTIDWDASSGLTSTNLDATFYVWDHSANGGAGSYLSWNGVTGTLGDGLIAPWQGFWVKANGSAPSLSLNDSVRSAGGVFLKKRQVPQLTITLRERNANSLNPLQNSAIVMLDEKASVSKDRLDGYKLKSLSEEFLSLFTQLPDGTGLDINALPAETEGILEIPIDLKGSNLNGEFELDWDIQTMPDDWQFTLIDNKTGQEVNLREIDAYSFELTTSSKMVEKEGTFLYPQHQVLSPKVLKAKSTGSRFTLVLNSSTSVSNQPGSDLPTKVELKQNYPNPFNPSTTIAYGVPETGEVTLEVFDILGRKVATLLAGERKSAGRYTVKFDASSLASGLYLYRLQVGYSVLFKKLTLIK